MRDLWDGPSTAPEYATVAEAVAHGLWSLEECLAHWAGVDWLPGKSGQTVLDVGCGNGCHRALFAGERGMAYTGCDVSEVMVEIARAAQPEGRFEQADATDLPYSDKQFDVSFCRALLLHVPGELELPIVQELIRVARVGVVQVSALLRPPRAEWTGWCGYHMRYETVRSELGLMREEDCGVQFHVKGRELLVKGTRPGLDCYFVFGQEAQA